MVAFFFQTEIVLIENSVAFFVNVYRIAHTIKCFFWFELISFVSFRNSILSIWIYDFFWIWSLLKLSIVAIIIRHVYRQFSYFLFYKLMNSHLKFFWPKKIKQFFGWIALFLLSQSPNYSLGRFSENVKKSLKNTKFKR